jgi:hypothetical protein
MTTKFRDLADGDVFEFDHSGLDVSCLQFAHGPWKKTGRTSYVDAERPERGKMRPSINAKVLRGTNCGRR